MAVIHELSPHLADLIAAGEVVERPSSVAKELVENAIDAGSTRITVEIENGGITYLRIADNGCGMSAEDAPVAFRRHATSKLRTEGRFECYRHIGLPRCSTGCEFVGYAH
ncbi:MAG: ATP-binding protein [Butyricicoccus sp.]